MIKYRAVQKTKHLSEKDVPVKHATLNLSSRKDECMHMEASSIRIFILPIEYYISRRLGGEWFWRENLF